MLKRLKKVKVSHTRYRALGLELIPVYRQAGDLIHPPSGRLPLLSARPAVTFPAAEHHCSLAGTHFTVPRRVEGWVDLGVHANRDNIKIYINNHQQFCLLFHLLLQGLGVESAQSSTVYWQHVRLDLTHTHAHGLFTTENIEMTQQTSQAEIRSFDASQHRIISGLQNYYNPWQMSHNTSFQRRLSHTVSNWKCLVISSAFCTCVYINIQKSVITIMHKWIFWLSHMVLICNRWTAMDSSGDIWNHIYLGIFKNHSRWMISCATEVYFLTYL